MLPKYKDIVELVKKGSDIEAQQEIIKWRESAVNLQEENLELKEKIKDLEEKLSLRNSLTFKKPVYYKEGDSDPFCQHCWEYDGKLIHLQQPDIGQGLTTYHCNTCNKYFTSGQYIREQHNTDYNSNSFY